MKGGKYVKSIRIVDPATIQRVLSNALPGENTATKVAQRMILERSVLGRGALVTPNSVVDSEQVDGEAPVHA